MQLSGDSSPYPDASTCRYVFSSPFGPFHISFPSRQCRPSARAFTVPLFCIVPATSLKHRCRLSAMPPRCFRAGVCFRVLIEPRRLRKRNVCPRRYRRYFAVAGTVSAFSIEQRRLRIIYLPSGKRHVLLPSTGRCFALSRWTSLYYNRCPAIRLLAFTADRAGFLIEPARSAKFTVRVVSSVLRRYRQRNAAAATAPVFAASGGRVRRALISGDAATLFAPLDIPGVEHE